jgi:transcriptional regulator with XRE-family HTH domain
MSRIDSAAPSPVDLHVGKMLRAYRQFAGLTLDEIGTAIGVTPQQFQKYERAQNRISASRLAEAARVLRISPGAFFEGIEPLESEERRSIFDTFTDFFTQPYSTRLADAFLRMNPHQQRALTELAETITPPSA